MKQIPFIETVRIEMRTRRCSLKTEKSYIYWIVNFIRFCDMRHPEDLGNLDIERFLNYLAVDRKVSAATQNLALCAIIFMYRNVIKREIEGLSYSNTTKPKRLPTVLESHEAQEILMQMKGKYKLITALLYGSGFRINEVLKLRIKDLNFENKTILVHRGKGAKDRYTIMPMSLIAPLQDQIRLARRIHERDLSEGEGFTSMSLGLKRKIGDAAKDFCWQYLFLSSSRCVHPFDGYICRHHIHESAFRKQLRKAVSASGVTKRVTAHTFRHSFATQLLQMGTDIRTVQELLGHSDLKTTEIYTHILGNRFGFTKSPVDLANLSSS
ncbi:integron integrase [Psychrosphaera aestuarii]|uniref:integron integrase n=1 Tax=Psychrosphaera aestuarii TaxID=1266052 RepID=UPI001B33CCC3|nr:integron integrase [Psychrosphaera aestuarii]